MPSHQPPTAWPIFCLLVLAKLFNLSLGEVGGATSYSPPFIPTACYANDLEQFPSSRLFGAAGEGIWDNGASCGRRYKVTCINGPTCVPDETIEIKIVDRAETSRSRPSVNGATIVLSDTAFATIANPSSKFIIIEFIEV